MARESLRAEARRRDVTISRVRAERAIERGLSPAQGRGHPRKGEQLVSQIRAPRTPAQVRTASPEALDLRSRQAEAVAWGRKNGVGASKSEREFGLPRGSLRRDFPTGVDAKGRFTASDSEAVMMKVVGPDGDQLVLTRSSRQRQIAGQHRIAVYEMLRGEISEEELRRRFRGKVVGGVELEVDGDRLRSIHELGLLTGGPYPEARK